MTSAVIVLLVCLVGAAVSEPRPETLGEPQRIVGGSLTTVSQYPFHTVLLYSASGLWYSLRCGGSLLNNRSVLSAAHCAENTQANNHRLRVGSSYASSGGSVHEVSQLIIHPQYNSWTNDNDVSILRSATQIVYQTNTIQPATIAGSNYNLGDNVAVWSIGHGTTSQGGSISEQLRHVQIWTVNQQVCRQRYSFATVTDNMLCSGWLDVGGRDACQGDSGGPLLHNNVVVGVCSWGYGCAQAYYPGVHTRVSKYTSWIQSNA